MKRTRKQKQKMRYMFQTKGQYKTPETDFSGNGDK